MAQNQNQPFNRQVGAKLWPGIEVSFRIIDNPL